MPLAHERADEQAPNLAVASGDYNFHGGAGSEESNVGSSTGLGSGLGRRQGRRFDVAYNRYVIGRIDIDNLYFAQGEKDQAVAQFVQALRGYWVAYYRLRRVTLYDFETGQPLR